MNGWSLKSAKQLHKKPEDVPSVLVVNKNVVEGPSQEQVNAAFEVKGAKAFSVVIKKGMFGKAVDVLLVVTDAAMKDLPFEPLRGIVKTLRGQSVTKSYLLDFINTTLYSIVISFYFFYYTPRIIFSESYMTHLTFISLIFLFFI